MEVTREADGSGSSSSDTLRLDGLGASGAELERARRTVTFLEQLLPALVDGAEAAQALRDIAMLKSDPLDDPAGALEAMRAAFKRSQSVVIARAYRKAAVRAGSVEDQLLALEGEAKAAPSFAYRAALELERGLLLERSLANPQAARHAYAQAVELHPADAPALTALLRLALREGDHATAAEQCSKIADCVVDAGVKAEYQAWSGRLLELAGQRPAALAAALRAEFLAPDSPSVRFLLERLLGLEDKPRELCVLLEAQVSAGLIEASEGWFDLGILQRYRVGDPDRAERAFTLVVASSEGASRAAALAELADLVAHKEDWPRLLAIEVQRAATEETPLGRAIAWTRIGQLREDKLADLDGAVDAYAKAIEADASHLPALEGAGRIYGQRGTIDRLLWMHKKEAAGATSPQERSAALRRAGELSAADPALLDEGIVLLDEAVRLAPDHAATFAALERALRKKGAFAELCTLYQREVDRGVEPRRRGALLTQIGELAAERLGDPKRAVAAFRAAAELDTSGPHYALLRLAQLLDGEGELAELEPVLVKLTALTEDPSQQASLYERAAILKEQRGDLDGAVSAYRRALDVAPASHAVFNSAGRAFARAQRYDELLALHEREMAGGDPAARTTFAYKAGVLLARRLDRRADGISRLKESLALSPANLPARIALAALYTEERRWEELRPLVAELPVSPALLVRRAALAEANGAPEEALALYQTALDRGVTVAARPRARLLAQLGRWRELAVSYEDEQTNGVTGAPAVQARYRAAELSADRLQQPERAVELLDAALAVEPTSIPLLLALKRILPEDSERKRTVLSQLIAAVDDSALRGPLLAELAAAPGLPEAELLATRASQLALAPRDPVLTVQLELVLEARRDREGLAAALRDLRRHGKGDSALAADAKARLGAVLEELGSLREAADSFEESLASSQNSLLARLALPRLYHALGDEARTVASLRSLAQSLPPGAERAVCLRRLAAHHRQRDDFEQAASTLEEALATHPLDFVALRELEGLVATSKPERLIDPLLRAFAVEKPGAQRTSIGLALAVRMLRAERLGPTREVLDQVLADDPAVLGALLLRAELEERLQAWPTAAAALDAVAAHADAATPLRAEALRRRARVQLDQLGDLEAARATAERLGELDPDGLASLEVRLQTAERAGNDPAQTAKLLERLIAHTDLDDERRAALQLALASLQDDKLGDAAAAIQTLGAIKLPGRRRDAVDRLLDLGGRTGRWDLAASALEQTLDRTGEMEPGWELAIRSRLANLLEGPLERRDSAARQYERIVVIDPGHVPALERLAVLSADSAPEKALDHHRALLAAEPRRLSSYRSMRQLFLKLGDQDGAFLTEAVLEAVGVADEEEAYFYRQRRALLSGSLEGTLTAEERELVAPEAGAPVFALLRALSPALAKVFPVDFNGYGVAPDEAPGQGALATIAARVATLFSVSAYRLLPAPNRIGPCVEPGVPPILFVPRNLDDATPREQLCVFGELMARVGFDAIVGDPRRLSTTSPALLDHLLWAACELSVADCQAPQRGRPVYEDVKRRLEAATSSRPRAELTLAATRVLGDGPVPSGDTILASMNRICTRAAILTAQDPAIAIASLRARQGIAGVGLDALPADLLAVLPFVVSRGLQTIRARLKIGVIA